MRFHKYSSTGNDFIIFDHNEEFKNELPSKEWVQKICQRRASVGADGLILVRKVEVGVVEMTYFNADGGVVEMCGNGLRAVGRYCKEILKVLKGNNLQIKTMNSAYDLQIQDFMNIKIRMAEIDDGELHLAGMYDAKYLVVGVPHVVKEVDCLKNFPLDMAKEIRHDTAFLDGTNVNFFQRIGSDEIRVRTFERGVESETLSCGTGVTACGYLFLQESDISRVHVQTEGGQLTVSRVGRDVFLQGPSELIFEGNFHQF